jgi:hypothetical protein
LNRKKEKTPDLGIMDSLRHKKNQRDVSKQVSPDECVHDQLRDFDRTLGDIFLKCSRCDIELEYCSKCGIDICKKCKIVVPIPIPIGYVDGEKKDDHIEERRKVNLEKFQVWYSEKMNTEYFQKLKKKGWWVAYWMNENEEKYCVASNHHKLIIMSPSFSIRTKIGEKRKSVIVSTASFYIEVLNVNNSREYVENSRNFDFLSEVQKEYLERHIGGHYFSKCEIGWKHDGSTKQTLAIFDTGCPFVKIDRRHLPDNFPRRELVCQISISLIIIVGNDTIGPYDFVAIVEDNLVSGFMLLLGNTFLNEFNVVLPRESPIEDVHLKLFDKDESVVLNINRGMVNIHQ